MKNELKIKIGSRDVKCILLDGFYSDTPPTSTLHRHNYAEVHILLGDRVPFELENQTLELSGCNVFAVPAGMLHRFGGTPESVRHSAFLTDFSLSDFEKREIPEALALSFFDEVKTCEARGDYTKAAAYITLLCRDIFSPEPLCATPITDLAFIINNFLSVNYNKDVSLADLAADLHYSEKQTARLVQKHTQMTFKQALIEYRMSVAAHLASTTDMPLSEIAEHVGYNSYNGFWQAYKQYKKKD